MRILLASANPHKLREFERLMDGVELESLPASVQLGPETGVTFANNAWAKARTAAEATQRPAIADDSGIEAAALGGRPGVRSARFAGENATDAENLERLRREVPPGSALAYVCALAFVDPIEAREHIVFGRCTGTMAPDPRGGHGFGYDPVFVPDDCGDGRTMAELSDPEKDAVSHRGRAARELLAWLHD